VRNAISQSMLASSRYNGRSAAKLNTGAEWDKFEVRLLVNNVFNKDPAIDVVESWGQRRVSTLRPRTVGLNLGVNF
jgi:hypothetical protein